MGKLGFGDSTFSLFCSAFKRELVWHVGKKSPLHRAWQPNRFEDRPQNFSVYGGWWGYWGGATT